MEAFQFEGEGGALDAAGTVFRDMLFLMVLGLVVVIFLITFLIAPVGKKFETEQRAEIVIEAVWPSGTKYDVDLWSMGPDGVPVGWGVWEAAPSLNLERDDRGKLDDVAEINFESISVRTLEAGEYVVNLHMFYNHGEPLPVPVVVTVVSKNEDIGRIFSGQVMLNHLREEVTVVRFSLDDDGNLVPGSVGNAYKEVIPVSSKFMRGRDTIRAVQPYEGPPVPPGRGR